MNPLKQFRKLRAVPDTPHVPAHSAGDERPSLAVVREMPTTAEVYADAAAQMATWLDDAPPDLPAPSARPDDPTPLWDEVMNDRRWASLPHTATLMRLAYEPHKQGRAPVATYHQEEMVLSNPPIDTQFETAFIVSEFDEDELAEIRREAVAAVDFGWGPV